MRVCVLNGKDITPLDRAPCVAVENVERQRQTEERQSELSGCHLRQFPRLHSSATPGVLRTAMSGDQRQ